MFIARGIKEHIRELVEIQLIRRNIIRGRHNPVCHRAFVLYDAVERMIYGAATYEIVACDIVFLSDTVGTVFTLTTIRIGPWKFAECNI